MLWPLPLGQALRDDCTCRHLDRDRRIVQVEEFHLHEERVRIRRRCADDTELRRDPPLDVRPDLDIDRGRLGESGDDARELVLVSQ